MTQAEFLQQPWDVVWMAADNAAHLFPVSLRFLEGFEQAAAHRLACNAVQRFLGERIAVRFQRTLQIFDAYDPARTRQDGGTTRYRVVENAILRRQPGCCQLKR